MADIFRIWNLRIPKLRPSIAVPEGRAGYGMPLVNGNMEPLNPPPPSVNYDYRKIFFQHKSLCYIQ